MFYTEQETDGDINVGQHDTCDVNVSFLKKKFNYSPLEVCLMQETTIE